MARGLAWYNADRLADPASVAAARESTTRNVQELVDQVLHPPVWTTRIVLKAGRLLVGMLRRWPRSAELA